ncbi:N-acetyltransferase family protein [Breznakia sp. OttesenSCG-928-G09]|nr:N-acetyltransferase family protein [Breznakia sp. OttesenSCG-928-G09]
MIRFITTSDIPFLRKIYAQYIDTAITFEYTLPSEEDFFKRVETIKIDYPFLVYEEAGQIIGYAYAHRYQARDAYQWNAELSIYLDEVATSKGLGKKFYQAIIEILKLQEVKTVYGIVTLPNKKSESLHTSLGFKQIGKYHNAGYKDKKWHDVAIFEKSIGEHTSNPAPFLPIHQITTKTLENILRKYNSNKHS